MEYLRMEPKFPDLNPTGFLVEKTEIMLLADKIKPMML